MKDNKKVALTIFLILILAYGTWFRLLNYGDMRLSVAMPDTHTFVESAGTPFLSFEDFSSRRLFTYNLLYRLSLGGSCEAPEVSIPYEGIEIERQIYDCFSNVALAQNILSILGWSILAITTAKWLKTPILKIVTVVIIMAFGYSPHIVEWDSILSSEALSISLLTFVLALFQEIAFQITLHKQNPGKHKNINILIGIWTVIFLLWCFVRDVQIYAAILTAVLVIPLLYDREIRNFKALTLSTIVISLAFLLGTTTAQASDRWQLSMEHVMNYHILPYPSRVEYLIDRGMPDPQIEEKYNTWLNTTANKDYAFFLVSHPGFIITTIFELSGYLNSDFLQPYFTTKASPLYEKMLIIGEMLHPQTNSVYLISFLLTGSLIILAIKHKDPTITGWAWLALWVFVYGSVSLVLSLFGDIDGTRRHIYPSVELFRLSNWIFLIAHLDLLSDKHTR